MKNKKRLALAALTATVILFAVSCQSAARSRIPTGVERYDGPNGTIRLVSTGMASDRAIEQDKVAMLQTTSREAARLLLVAELEKPAYAKIKDSFEMQEAEFIDRGLYCRLTSVYTPPPPPKKVAPEKSPARIPSQK